MELLLIKDWEKSFDKTIKTIKNNLSASRLECVALDSSRDEILLMLKVLETDLV